MLNGGQAMCFGSVFHRGAETALSNLRGNLFIGWFGWGKQFGGKSIKTINNSTSKSSLSDCGRQTHRSGGNLKNVPSMGRLRVWVWVGSGSGLGLGFAKKRHETIKNQ